ncbi:MAG: sodium-dependent bicarbonate transport family permease, partial [Beijerinckiaceae bacterium]|nr:sodium-dependent bicarbonate transport family permease [Beijerinckiaceae bacterium]
FIRSELELPEPVLKLISIYLLFSIGLTGGRELARAEPASLLAVFAVALALTLAIPIVSYLVLRRLGRFDIANAAAIAAHYGSVSSVTFFAALTFTRAMGNPAEGYVSAIVALMEWGVIVALLIARIAKGREAQAGRLGAIIAETLRGRGVLLLTGGMTIGFLANDAQWDQIAPFYEHLFRGILMLFLLEMGMTASRHIRAYAGVGRFMTVFAILSPVIWGITGVLLGKLAGLGMGGAFVLGAIAASSSYIDAPAACKAALPEANPGIYLTASLGVTFPFNMLVGLPLLYQAAAWLYGAG